MTPTAWPRFLKFSLVGALGIAVQFGVLALLTAIQINYLLATGLAVECAVLHNFLWHLRFTWSDRTPSGGRSLLQSLFRFHLSNGLISLMGNLLLMRILVGRLSLPPLDASPIAIAACFALNFQASDRWVFLCRGYSCPRNPSKHKNKIDVENQPRRRAKMRK